MLHDNPTFISSGNSNSSMSHPPPRSAVSSSSSSSRRSSFSWDTSRSSRSDQNGRSSLRETMNTSELELSSIIDNVLDYSSSPFIDFDSQRSPSTTGSIWVVKQAVPAALRRQYSETDMNRVRMSRESESLYIIVTCMDIVRKNNAILSRRGSDAHTV